MDIEIPHLVNEDKKYRFLEMLHWVTLEIMAYCSSSLSYRSRFSINLFVDYNTNCFCKAVAISYRIVNGHNNMVKASESLE